MNRITHLRALPYQIQVYGQTERFVDTFRRALIKGGDERKPSQVIKKILTAYRTTSNQHLETLKVILVIMRLPRK